MSTTNQSPATRSILLWWAYFESNWTVLNIDWTGGELQHTITGLVNGTKYDVQVRAVYSKGHSPWSFSASGTPSPFVPVTLRWDPPAVTVGENAQTVTLRAVAQTTGGAHCGTTPLLWPELR